MIDAPMGVGGETRTDYVVVGRGIAGMRAAIELAKSGDVLVLTKSEGDSTPRYAQGDIVFPEPGGEDVSLHFHETLRGGDGLCREAAVKVLMEEAPRELKQVSHWGAKFEWSDGGRAHAHPRAPGSVLRSAGQEIFRALAARLQSLSSVEVRRGAVAVELLRREERVCGIMYLDQQTGGFRRINARAVLLATGGAGQVYADTTNSASACGDGLALALAAGALLSDMEFIQFHPTALCTGGAPRLPLPVAALREEGAQLRNVQLERFLKRYHEAGELAPPDLLTRAIVMEMQRTGSNLVYLDFTNVDPHRIRKRFPQVYASCLEHNIDITSDLVPTRPAQLFCAGGVATDLRGASTLAGLYAAGEVAATGVHGASRVAHNALLESLVFGARAAAAMVSGSEPASFPPGPSGRLPGAQAARQEYRKTGWKDLAKEIRCLMWNSAGIIREGSKLSDARDRLKAMALPPLSHPSREYYETMHLLESARVIARCAEARKESRGAHYRADFPLRSDSEPARHSFISRDGGPYFSN